MTEVLQPISLTAATYTLDKKAHGGAVLLLNRAAGVTCTLPASSGDGTKFRLVVHTTVTSNNDIVKVANSTDIMQGVQWTAQDAGATVNAFETASTDDTITLNGTTTGGIKGDYIDLIDVAAGFWQVEVFCSATGTEATCFSATV